MRANLYLSTAIDLFSPRLLGYATSCHPDAELAVQTIKMPVATCGRKERIAGVIFHSDRRSTYTAHDFTALCHNLDIRQSMGRTGSCFDNVAAESFFSTLEHEVLSVIILKPGRSATGYCEMDRRILQLPTTPQFL